MLTLASKIGPSYSVREPPEGDIGIEIELESQTEFDPHTKPFNPVFWNIHNDGSLKFGYPYEFALIAPVKIDKVPLCLKEFVTLSSRHNIKPLENSRRTSVHVHVNVHEYNHRELYNLISCYWLAEPLLVAYSGQHRAGNNFCLSITEAEELKIALIRGLKKKNYFYNVFEHDWRYSALNLDALAKFGSVEFRSMRGVYDPGIIEEWVNELYTMCQAAKSFHDPDDVLGALSKKGEEGFIHTIFGDRFATKIIKHFGVGWQDAMIENTMSVIDLANALPSWEITKEDEAEAAKVVPKPKVKPKEYRPRFNNQIRWDDPPPVDWVAMAANLRPLRAAGDAIVEGRPAPVPKPKPPRPRAENAMKKIIAQDWINDHPFFDEALIGDAAAHYVGVTRDINGNYQWRALR